VNGDGRLGAVRLRSEEDELAGGVHRDCDDALDADGLAEGIIAPRETFVESVRDVVRDVLVVGEDQDRTLISVLPHVSVLVYLFPGETPVASQEGVRVGVGDEVLADVSDCEHETDGGGRRVGCARVLALGVAVDVKGAGLVGRGRVSGRKKRKGKREERRTVPEQSYC
jgi:hypothetical protein